MSKTFLPATFLLLVALGTVAHAEILPEMIEAMTEEPLTDGTPAFKERIQNYDGSVLIVQPMVARRDGSLEPVAFGSIRLKNSPVCAFFDLGELKDAAGAPYRVLQTAWLGPYDHMFPPSGLHTPLLWVLCGPKSPVAKFSRVDRVEFGPPGSLSDSNTVTATFMHPFVRGSGGTRYFIGASNVDDVCISLGYKRALSLDLAPAKNSWSAKIGPRGLLEGYQSSSAPIIRQLTCSAY